MVTQLPLTLTPAPETDAAVPENAMAVALPSSCLLYTSGFICRGDIGGCDPGCTGCVQHHT